MYIIAIRVVITSRYIWIRFQYFDSKYDISLGLMYPILIKHPLACIVGQQGNAAGVYSVNIDTGDNMV